MRSGRDSRFTALDFCQVNRRPLLSRRAIWSIGPASHWDAFTLVNSTAMFLLNLPHLTPHASSVFDRFYDIAPSKPS